jgi:DNA-binding transcriptional MerR regulator
MRIGEMAAQAGVHIQTVRLYERMGILKEPRRTRAGYRDYSAEAAETIRFIKSAQEMGFTLREIKTLVRLRDGGDHPSGQIRDLALLKIDEINQKIARLERMREALRRGLEDCACKGRPEACLLLKARAQTKQ